MKLVYENSYLQENSFNKKKIHKQQMTLRSVQLSCDFLKNAE